MPLGQKLAFGIGSLSDQLFNAAMGVFLAVLVLALNMDPLLAGILASAPRIFDAITDPLMGYISDNTRTRWGRRKPFVFLGTVLSGISYFAMWQLYPENSMMYNFYYFLFLSFAFYLGFTIFKIPLTALGYEMSEDYHERTRIMAISQWIGQLAWVIAPWFWVLMFVDTLFETPSIACRTVALWVAVLCTAFGIVPAIFCKERELPEYDESTELSLANIGKNAKEFIRGVVQTTKCKPFLLLCGATFFVYNGYMLVIQFQYVITVHYVFAGSASAAGNYPAWNGTLGALATCLFVIPLITWFATHVGKKRAFIIAMLISVVGYLLKWVCFNPEIPWLMFLPLPLISFGIGALFTLMLSMTADVCDVDELEVGERREGMLGAVYWWFVKLGNALAWLGGGVVLKLIGFNQTPGAVQTVETLTQLRLVDALAPAITTIIGVMFIWKFDVGEARMHEIRKELDARNEKAKIAKLEEQPDLGEVFV